MIDFNALVAANANRWPNAKLTRDFTAIARRLVAPEAMARYRAVEQATGVPPAVVAVIHMRECSQDWTGSLAQGDPWNRVSVHVPAGRGPFRSWEEAAIDALVNCAPYAARNTEWSIGRTLAKLEQYNGLGYAARGRPSPYIWSGTDQYVSGKYVRDGVYDPNVVDSQPGCAGLLITMMKLDPSISFAGAAAIKQAPRDQAAAKPTAAPPPAKTAPSITNPAAGSIGAFVAGVLSAIFKRR